MNATAAVFRRLVGGALWLGGLGGLSYALTRAVLPRDPLPPVTGPHPVGTSVAVVEAPRRLPVQIWYPGQATGGPNPAGTPAALFPASAGVAQAIASHYGMPRGVAPALGLVLGRIRGRAVGSATPAWPSGSLPTPRGVLIISHGWLGFRVIHVDLAEQLASDGWVVVAVDHVGGALASQFPDHAVTPLSAGLMPPDGVADYWPRAAALVQRYATDIAAVLDAVAAGRLGPTVPATERFWLLGHSTGGGAAIVVAGEDRRVAGVIGMDPWVEPLDRSARQRLTVPTIAILSGQWVGNRNDALLQMMGSVELRAVPEARHTDLTVLGYLSPVRRILGLTRCDPALPRRAALKAVADLTNLAVAKAGID
ncbi:MAG: serine aminopeptidase domain-containing protein [Euzebya sp.]